MTTRGHPKGRPRSLTTPLYSSSLRGGKTRTTREDKYSAAPMRAHSSSKTLLHIAIIFHYLRIDISGTVTT